MKILVTGGTGFIGSHLVRMLLGEGYPVRVLTRTLPSGNAPITGDVEYIRGDLCDAAGVRKAMEGCGTVFHLAAFARAWAEDARLFERINVDATESLLRSALDCGISRVVFTSSNLTLGPSNGTPVDEAVTRKEPYFTPYERSKALAEERIRQYVGRALDVVIVNPSRVFGPGPLNEANSVTRMIRMYIDGTWRFILGDGSSLGNYVFVEDVAVGHILAWKYGKSGERYILGGENLSFDDFFRILSDITRTSKRMIHIPLAVALGFAHAESLRGKLSGHAPLLTGEWVRLFARDWACSSDKARKALGYQITPFREALQKTVDWLHGERRTGREASIGGMR